MRLHPTLLVGLLCCNGGEPVAANDADGGSSGGTPAGGESTEGGTSESGGSSVGGSLVDTGGASVGQGGLSATGGSGSVASDAVELAFLVHLEGWDVGTEEVFNGYSNKIRDLMSLFEGHGSKLTLESVAIKDGQKESLVQGIEAFGGNILTEAISRGHSVGLHGAAKMGLEPTLEVFKSDLTYQKGLIESVGVQVEHVSNICSSLDWVTALSATGFKFATGIVEYCAKSLPIEIQSESTANCTSPVDCHNPYPESLSARLHPWRTSSPNWLLKDPNGPLVVLTGAYNMSCFFEEIDAPGSYTTCPITSDDTDAYLNVLDTAVAEAASSDEVTALVVVWSFGANPTDAELPVLDDLLTKIDAYVADGRAHFATANEIYDQFVELE